MTLMGAYLPALSIALALLLQASAPSQRFKSSIDVVQVDVSAIDGNGRPITDLKADEFELRVDGRPRRITSVQFVSVPSAVATPAQPAAVAPVHFSTNADAVGGRLIMVVVDRSSIASGRGRAAIDAASRFVSQLNRADRVALASIPHGPQVTFTADHALVQRRIQEIDGTAVASLGVHNLGIADALAFERRSDSAMRTVYERECGAVATSAGGRGGGAGGQSDVLLCQNEVRSEAIVVAQDARERARTTIQSLRYLIDSLPPSQTPKIMVLISEGLVIDRETTQLSWLDAKAAAAHVTIFSLHLESSQIDASQRSPRAQPAADRALQEQGLDRLASATRGDVFRIMSNSDFAFQRLALELSGYYLLGFEPEGSDRGGKPHAITVAVRRNGVTVRSRRQFSMEGATASSDAAGQIVATLRDPLPATEIPIKLAAYSFRDPNHDKLRLLVAAEIDRSINPSGQLTAGFVVVDFDGKAIASQMDAALESTRSRDGMNQRYFSTVLADPGKYTIKFAAVDDARRRGSVELLTDAHLTAAGPLRVTDLLIVDGTAGAEASPQAPIVSGDIRGKTLHGYLELFADSADALNDASVTLEIAQSESSPALERVPVQLATTKESVRCRVASARIDLAKFPPGNYVARAVIAIGLDAVGQVTRPFKIEGSGAPRP
jgi:VWFA-related protein